MTLTARRLLEMKSGRDALLHTIGEDDSVCVKQLPYPGVCEASDDHNTHPPRDPWRFGYALAASFMKLTRPEVDYRIDIECMFDLSSYVEAMPNEQTRHGFLCGIETLLSIALLYPERLPIIIERLDTLDNATLTEQATRALLYEPVGANHRAEPFYYGDDGGIFAGLVSADGGRP